MTIIVFAYVVDTSHGSPLSDNSECGKKFSKQCRQTRAGMSRRAYRTKWSLYTWVGNLPASRVFRGTRPLWSCAQSTVELRCDYWVYWQDMISQRCNDGIVINELVLSRWCLTHLRLSNLWTWLIQQWTLRNTRRQVFGSMQVLTHRDGLTRGSIRVWKICLAYSKSS